MVVMIHDEDFNDSTTLDVPCNDSPQQRPLPQVLAALVFKAPLPGAANRTPVEGPGFKLQ